MIADISIMICLSIT